jgi:hypothetical protein
MGVGHCSVHAPITQPKALANSYSSPDTSLQEPGHSAVLRLIAFFRGGTAIMKRHLFLASGAVFLLTTLMGIAIPILLQKPAAAAPLQQSERVTRGKRILHPSFELDVLVDGRRLHEFHERGRTFVEAERGAEYELRLRNSSPDRVAVALSVDGLNTIDAEQTSAWNASKWVIEPYGTITITGWQMSSERARKFYFTTERDSYAAKLGRKADFGVISAVFFRERRRPIPITREQPATQGNAPSPAAEPQLRADSEMSRADRAATGIGRSVRNDVRTIDMDLESRPVAEVSLRYQYSAARGRFCPEPGIRRMTGGLPAN